MRKFGIDISMYQKGFDFDRAKKEGVEFAILRGGYHLLKDACFEEFYEACRQRNIPVGVYLYSMARTVEEGEEEAEFLINKVLKGKRFDYPIYMDVEDRQQRSVGKNKLTEVVIAFCNKLKQAGYCPGVYSSLSFFKTHLKPEKLTDYEIWVAQWYTRCDFAGEYGMWQFGGETNAIRSNKVAGVVCDQDYACKDYPAIIRAAGLNGWGTVKEPVKTKEDTVNLKVLKNGSKGSPVKALQILLIGNGCSCGSWGADGNFGAATEKAVRNYQKKKKLQVDGQAGPETWRSLLGVA